MLDAVVFAAVISLPIWAVVLVLVSIGRKL